MSKLQCPLLSILGVKGHHGAWCTLPAHYLHQAIARLGLFYKQGIHFNTPVYLITKTQFIFPLPLAG